MFNGIFNQFLDQTVENPPKIVGGANRKIRPLWGDLVVVTIFSPVGIAQNAYQT
jgi:hypothetical protein